MARQFFEGGPQQAGQPPSFAMQRHVLPSEPERFMNAPPQAGHNLGNAWNEMQAAGRSGTPAEMLRAHTHSPTTAGGWSSEFDGVAQIAHPSGQQNMPMQSNCEFYLLVIEWHPECTDATHYACFNGTFPAPRNLKETVGLLSFTRFVGLYMQV